MTQPPFNGPIPISELPSGQTFDEYRWSQLVEEGRRNTAAIAELKRRADDQVNRADGLHRRVVELEGQQETHHSEVGELLERLTFLEDQLRPAAKPRDDLSERIVAFLEAHPDLKFTAISIDENLDGTGKDLSDRLKTLARNGRVVMHANDKRRPFYQAMPRSIEPVHPA